MELEIDVENDLNYYGSDIEISNHSHSSSDSSSNTSEEEVQHASQVGSERTSCCSCKNTCSRKTTKKTTGCPCKTTNSLCSHRCKCGTTQAPCKNRAPVLPLEPTVSEAQENTSAADRVICSCKNTCSRRRTTTSAGCPCKTANVECCESCRCGTAKSQCKNRTIRQAINRNPSAFARHQEQLEKAETEIKDFIQHLTDEDKNTLLVRLLTQGRGSLQFARDMLTNDSEHSPSSPVPGPSNLPGWCICGVCRIMPLDIENKCCAKRTCVTSYEMFSNICIDREVLTLAIRARFDIMAEEADYSSNSFRKASYRQYCLWKYGKLGRGNRRVLPSCVVTTIRQAYPAADGVYMGYRES